LVPTYADAHTTIVDNATHMRRRAPWALMLAMFIGGVAGLGLAAWRASSGPAEAPALAVEMLPPLDESVLEVEPEPTVEEAPVVAAAPAKVEPALEIITDRVRANETLSIALNRHGVTLDEVNTLVASLKGTLDARTIRAGDVYRLERKALEEGTAPLDRFEFEPRRIVGAPTTYVATRDDDGFDVAKNVVPIETKVVALGGEVKSNLYLAIKKIGEGAGLVGRFVDVFAWDIDFYRQTQKGDAFKVIVEKQYADGRFVGYGKVLAAEYINAGRAHRGFAFASDDGKLVGIYDENGKAREKTFLKNPLSYGQRFHPILRRNRSHNGVDYGASSGTPFWAVADGVVKEARYSRTAGNMLVIQHINGYTTEYFHASRFAEGIRPGARVQQRQVIAYVGNTGRSTGPHLHFGMKKRGHYVDPGKQKFPAAKPVPRKYLEEYREWVAPLLAELEALEQV
jgi:murein DD-endopeptidase MepM/ murein hydrolase activator NlpD